jgi:uncharacterized protein
MGLDPSSPSTGLVRPKTVKSGLLLRGHQVIVAHWRLVVSVLILAVFTPLVKLLLELNVFFLLIGFALLLIFIASHVFWIGRVLDLGQRFMPGKPGRARLAIVTGPVYLFFLGYWVSRGLPGHHARAADLLLVGTFAWWFVGSQLAFLLVIAFGTADRAARAAGWLYRKACETIQGHGAASRSRAIAPDPPSPGRRRFLEQTAVLVSATPFVAVGYGLLYERLDVEIVRQRIRLARLPRAFEGFRIAQLSDFHFSPFTAAGYIRHCVTVTNGLKPDLVVMTGDYVDWDPAPQQEVVEVLAGLRAPHGVFGCLGNHESITQTEESISRLFAAHGIRILRQERAPIRIDDKMLNLIGIDSSVFIPGKGHSEDWWRAEGDQRWQQVKGLAIPETVNILLTHYPWAFDRAAQFGMDLVLAGHTHGGQLCFVTPNISFSRLETPYVSGWYEKGGAQLYVNRGIGTIDPNIRLGARPEITVLELIRP